MQVSESTTDQTPLRLLPEGPSALPPWSLTGSVFRGVLCGLLLCLTVDIGNHLFARNLHVVIPGLVYRCSQPTGADVEWLVRTRGIRTIINLRGSRDSQSWHRDECRAAHRLNVCVEDIGFSAGHLPPVQEVRRLVEVLDHCDYPLVFHCYRGVDRTGLASVIALLLKTDTPLEEALGALSLRHVHLPWGRTGNLDRFFDLYADWLQANGKEHTSTVFRTWVMAGYRGGCCSCRLELVGPLLVGPRALPLGGSWSPWVQEPSQNRTDDGSSARLLPRQVRAPLGVPFALRVRCHNTSYRTWRFHPDPTAGIHGLWLLLDDENRYLNDGFAGCYHAEVPPGGFIDLTVPLPPLRVPGRYGLQFDLMEMQHCYFHQAGSEPLELELVVE